LATLVAAGLLILPMHTFGEREHVALITLMPLLAMATACAKGARPALMLAIAASIGGGITAIIKPHFAVAIVAAAAVAAWHARSWRPLFALESGSPPACLPPMPSATRKCSPRTSRGTGRT